MARSTPDAAKPQATGTCPICSAPTQPHYRPFCSRRCADVDLSRWLRGAYAIPDQAEDEDGASTDAAASDGDQDDAAGRKS